MTAMAIAFDTLKFANRLKQTGVKPEIAEAHAEAEAEALDEATFAHLATKKDINDLKLSTKEDVNSLKDEVFVIKEDILVIKTDIHRLNSNMQHLKNELIMKLGGITVACATIIATLHVIFHV